MKIWKKLFAGALAAMMMLSMTACSDTTWVFDYNGEKIPSGLYIAYTMNAYASVSSQEGYDSSITDVMKQTVNGKAAKEWIQEEAKSYCSQFMAVQKKFDELGLELTEEDQSSIDSTIDAVWPSVGTIYEQNGVSQSTYRKIIENGTKKTKIFDKYYNADNGIEPVSDESLQVQFKENYALVNSVSVSLKTGDDLSDEDKAENEERKAKAEEYLKLINGGEATFGEIEDRNMHEVAGTEHNADDDDDVISKDEDERSYVKKDSTSPSEKVVKAIFDEVKPGGEAKLIADDNAYYIVKRYDVTEDGKNFEEMRSTVLHNLKDEAFSTLIEEWANALSPTVNDASVRRYNPKNINFDTPSES